VGAEEALTILGLQTKLEHDATNGEPEASG